MMVGLSNDDLSGTDRRTVDGMRGKERTAASQDVRNRRNAPSWHVGHNKNRRRKRRGKIGDDALQRVECSGAPAEDDDGKIAREGLVHVKAILPPSAKG